MKRKKNGTSLIVVVILLMLISIVSMAVLSMGAGNYKARVIESQRVENLYSSDSGLDVAYNVIGKTFDTATKYGYWKVEALKNGNNTGPYNQEYQDIVDDINLLNTDIYNWQHINDGKAEDDQTRTSKSDIDNGIAKAMALIEEDENVKNVLCNEEFKRTFKNYIAKTSEVTEEENVPDTPLLQELIEEHQYVTTVSAINIDYFADESRTTIEFLNENRDPLLEVKDISLSNNLTPVTIIYQLTGHHKTANFAVYGDQEYSIAVTSDFWTQELEGGNKVNERQLRANYRMSVPDYEDIYFKNEEGNLRDYLALKDRSLTVCGNVNVNNVDNLNINGKIFVEGKATEITQYNRSFEKYYGGITISDSNQVNFSDDVVTRRTFNIQNNVNATVDGNLYAKNIYAGNIGSDDNGIANGSTLNVINVEDDKGQVIIDNDLAVKANNTTISIKDFYGINDYNITTGANGLKTSSSIIINGSDGTNVNINNLAYIMGMAHIDTVEDYQTAESGAVKGNYIAYTVSLDEAEQFKFYDPLQLLDADQITKEKHFINYWSQAGMSPDAGGIHWPVDSYGNISKENIHSVGVIVYKGIAANPMVIPSNYDADLFTEDSVVGNKKIQFAKEVYKFGQASTWSDYVNGVMTDFNSLIDTANIPSDYNLESQANNGEYAILNGDANKEIKIMATDENKDSIKVNHTDKVIEIYVSKKSNAYTLNAVIASAGNISIKSDDITINGCIITKGDLGIHSHNDVTINYDMDVIERVQAQNTEAFKAVFGRSVITDTTSPNSNTDNAYSNYDLKKFLKNNLWRILK